MRIQSAHGSSAACEGVPVKHWVDAERTADRAVRVQSSVCEEYVSSYPIAYIKPA